MNNEKIVLEATQEVDEAIMHLARIKLAKRCIASEERFWVDKVKSLMNPALCDKILAPRDGEMVTVAVYQRPFPQFDTQRFKQDHADLSLMTELIDAQRAAKMPEAAFPL